MYMLKAIPEDFIVKEKSTTKVRKNGRYQYFIFKKRNLNTIAALQLVAKKLKAPFKKFGFAGNKDKKAVTEQVCSFASEKTIQNFKTGDIEVVGLGRGDNPVSLGDLEGNFFEITIRNLSIKPKLIGSFINYFGEQRFGRNNNEIGKAMIKRDFDKACLLINNPAVNNYLKEHPTNFIGALRQLPKKLLRLYIHSYQSSLWNRIVKRFADEKMPLPEKLELVGFGTKLDESNASKLIEELMKKEGITFRDFIIKEMPEISEDGGARDCYADVIDLSIGDLKDDELNPQKKKCKISFFLEKGCYATEFIRQLFA